MTKDPSKLRLVWTMRVGKNGVKRTSSVAILELVQDPTFQVIRSAGKASVKDTMLTLDARPTVVWELFFILQNDISRK